MKQSMDEQEIMKIIKRCLPIFGNNNNKHEYITTMRVNIKLANILSEVSSSLRWSNAFQFYASFIKLSSIFFSFILVRFVLCNLLIGVHVFSYDVIDSFCNFRWCWFVFGYCFMLGLNPDILNLYIRFFIQMDME